jgi:ATP:cob(I)alamin adenosyltransferase
MFTGRGDKGETDTGTGERVNKGSAIIDLEGDLDELNSFVGFARSISRWSDIKRDLEAVQRDLFTVGEHVTLKGRKRVITEDRVKWLEERISEYGKEFGKVTLFVLQGGSQEASALHIARTVCRRAERDLTRIASGREIDKAVQGYMNRLSSLFFYHALVSNKRLGVEEEIWPLKYP